MTTLSREQLQIDRLLDRATGSSSSSASPSPLGPRRPESLKGYLERRVYPELGKECFSFVYVHAGVPGLSALRSFLDAVPADVKRRLEAVYFLHPGFQDRLFLATFGRFLFPGGLYGKVKYVNRLEYLWKHVRRNKVKLPEFVCDFDEKIALQSTTVWRATIHG